MANEYAGSITEVKLPTETDPYEIQDAWAREQIEELNNYNITVSNEVLTITKTSNS